MFRFVVRAVVGLAAIAALGVGISPAQAAPISTDAPIAVAIPPVATPRLVDVDVQQFRRFDRLTLRFRGGTPDLRARYVRFAVDQDGEEVDLPGRHLLVLQVRPARARDLDRDPVRVRAGNVRAFQLIEDRRGVVRLAVGVRQRVGVRVIELPNRLIVDVPSRRAF